MDKKLEDMFKQVREDLEIESKEDVLDEALEDLNKHYIPISEVEEIKEKYLEKFLKWEREMHFPSLKGKDRAIVEDYDKCLMEQYKTKEEDEHTLC